MDETYIGGKRPRTSNARRKKLAGTGRGAVGKAVVAGVKDRATGKIAAKVVKAASIKELHGFVQDNVDPGATVYTDDARPYVTLPFKHEAVKHKVREYARGQATKKRRRIVLVAAKARPPQHVRQNELSALAAVRDGVRGSPQRARSGYHTSNGSASPRDERRAANVQGAGREVG